MFMYSNGPGSTRRALTVRATGSVVRSLTQLHTCPFSSGCMVSRNRTVSPWRSRISAAEYSVNSCGHDSTWFVMDQTRSNGASMVTEFSVWPGTSHHRRLRVDLHDDLGDRHLQCLVRHLPAELVLDDSLQLEYRERIDSEFLERALLRLLEKRGIGPRPHDKETLYLRACDRQGTRTPLTRMCCRQRH